VQGYCKRRGIGLLWLCKVNMKTSKQAIELPPKPVKLKADLHKRLSILAADRGVRVGEIADKGLEFYLRMVAAASKRRAGAK